MNSVDEQRVLQYIQSSTKETEELFKLTGHRLSVVPDGLGGTRIFINYSGRQYSTTSNATTNKKLNEFYSQFKTEKVFVPVDLLHEAAIFCVSSAKTLTDLNYIDSTLFVTGRIDTVDRKCSLISSFFDFKHGREFNNGRPNTGTTRGHKNVTAESQYTQARVTKFHNTSGTSAAMQYQQGFTALSQVSSSATPKIRYNHHSSNTRPALPLRKRTSSSRTRNTNQTTSQKARHHRPRISRY